MTDIKEPKRDIYKSIKKEKVLESLIEIFGSVHVSNKPHDLYPYSYDATESEGHMPDFTVLPECVDEIVQMVKFCNEHGIPLIPYVSGNNVGGLTIPEQGGIICDMGKRMKKVIKIHESMMYAILEPGVTWGQLKNYLDAHHPGLKYGYTYAPPYASVLANGLLSGMSNLSTSHGCMADWVNGLEVVLNDGNIVRTGSCFLSSKMKDDNWFARYPIPDLTSVFLCWQGTTGIVTKMAVQLIPKKNYNTALLILVFGTDECVELVKEIGRTECCEDVSAMNVEILKMTFELDNPPKLEGEPDFGIVISISGKSLELLEAKANYVKQVVEKIKKKTDKGIFLTNFSPFVNLLGSKFAIYYDLPNVIVPMFKSSGVTWVGCYSSTDHVSTILDKCHLIFKENDKEPLMFMKSMNNSHYCTIMAILSYNRNSELEKTKKLQEQFLNVMLDNDAIPYKAPIWMTNEIRKRCDQNWLTLLEKVKKVMDPHDIFNPGRWGL